MMDSNVLFSLILIAYEFTSDISRALEFVLGTNESNFAVRNIVELRFNDKCLVANAK